MTIDREELRLQILLALHRNQPTVTLNQEELIKAVPMMIDRSAMRVELAWLERVEAVATRQPGGVMMATLTGDGLQHLECRALIPDIGVPTPAQMVR